MEDTRRWASDTNQNIRFESWSGRRSVDRRPIHPQKTENQKRAKWCNRISPATLVVLSSRCFVFLSLSTIALGSAKNDVTQEGIRREGWGREKRRKALTRQRTKTDWIGNTRRAGHKKERRIRRQRRPKSVEKTKDEGEQRKKKKKKKREEKKSNKRVRGVYIREDQEVNVLQLVGRCVFQSLLLIHFRLFRSVTEWESYIYIHTADTPNRIVALHPR